MPAGSCLCGEIKISYTGEAAYTAICYCNDDRKMSNAQTHQVPESQFTLVQGTPKVFTMKSDFDRDIHSHFCPTCGTTLWRSGGSPNVAGMIGLRAGVLDDQSLINENPPKVEVYVERRPKWIKQVEGAVQLNGKYEVVGGGELGATKEG